MFLIQEVRDNSLLFDQELAFSLFIIVLCVVLEWFLEAVALADDWIC